MSKVSLLGAEWGKQGEEDGNYNSNPYGRPKVEELPEEEKEKPNFGLTGNLAKDEQHGKMQISPCSCPSFLRRLSLILIL